MNSIIFKALAIHALLTVSLMQAVPSQAATLVSAVSQSIGYQAYVSPGVAALFDFLMSMFR